MKFRNQKLSPVNKKKMEERDEEIRYLWYKGGLTGPEIGRRYDLSRMRVYQIIQKGKPIK